MISMLLIQSFHQKNLHIHYKTLPLTNSMRLIIPIWLLIRRSSMSVLTVTITFAPNLISSSTKAPVFVFFDSEKLELMLMGI